MKSTILLIINRQDRFHPVEPRELRFLEILVPKIQTRTKMNQMKTKNLTKKKKPTRKEQPKIQELVQTAPLLNRLNIHRKRNLGRILTPMATTMMKQNVEKLDKNLSKQ